MNNVASQEYDELHASIYEDELKGWGGHQSADSENPAGSRGTRITPRASDDSTSPTTREPRPAHSPTRPSRTAS